MSEFLATWILLTCALVCASPVVWCRIMDHSMEEEFAFTIPEGQEDATPPRPEIRVENYSVRIENPERTVTSMEEVDMV
jgi:hypothetical protein